MAWTLSSGMQARVTADANAAPLGSKGAAQINRIVTDIGTSFKVRVWERGKNPSTQAAFVVTFTGLTLTKSNGKALLPATGGTVSVLAALDFLKRCHYRIESSDGKNWLRCDVTNGAADVRASNRLVTTRAVYHGGTAIEISPTPGIDQGAIPRVTSPDGTTITSPGQKVVDIDLAEWEIRAGDRGLLRNGVAPTANDTTKDVDLAGIWNDGIFHQRNTSGTWFAWTGTAWTSAVDPQGTGTGGGGGGTPEAGSTVLWSGDTTISDGIVGIHNHSFPASFASPYRLESPSPTYIGTGAIPRAFNAGDQAPQNNGFSWPNVELSDGVFTWTDPDAWWSAYSALGCTRFTYCHGPHQPAFHSVTGGIWSTRAPKSLAALTRWTRELCLHFPTTLETIEAWNEPENGNGYFDGTDLELLDIQYATWLGIQQAKAINPAVIAKCGAPAYVNFESDFAQVARYLRARLPNGIGAKDITEAISFHFYEVTSYLGNDDSETLGKSIANSRFGGVDAMTKLRHVYRDGGLAAWATVPFYDSEHGHYWPGFQDAGPAGQATHMKRYAAYMGVRGIRSIQWYAGDSFGSENTPGGYPIPGWGTPYERYKNVPLKRGLIGAPSYDATVAAGFTWMTANLRSKRATLLEIKTNGAWKLTYFDGTSVEF